MKKLFIVIGLLIFSCTLVACDPTTTEASMNTNLTQSTTIALDNIIIEADHQEVYLGDFVNITISFLPSNASIQTYSISIDDTSIVNFVGTNTMQLEALAVGETRVWVYSDDGVHEDNVRIVVHEIPST